MKKKIRSLVLAVSGYVDKMEPLVITSSQNDMIIRARQLVLETLENLEDTNDSKKLEGIMEHLDETYCQIIQELKLTPEIAETVEDRKNEELLSDAKKASKDVKVKVKKKKKSILKKGSKKDSSVKSKSKTKPEAKSKKKDSNASGQVDIEKLKNPIVVDMIKQLSNMDDPKKIAGLVSKLMSFMHTLTIEFDGLKTDAKANGSGLQDTKEQVELLVLQANQNSAEIYRLNKVNKKLMKQLKTKKS